MPSIHLTQRDAAARRRTATGACRVDAGAPARPAPGGGLAMRADTGAGRRSIPLQQTRTRRGTGAEGA
jgi:hypothetical protein